MPRNTFLIIVSMIAFFDVLKVAGVHADTGWDGIWFECEFSSRTEPPADGCAMLDDDGFIFSQDRVTYIKVIGSPETDTCKKQRPGQCFRADEPLITTKTIRGGQAIFTPTTLAIKFLGCTQTYHATDLGGYLEARPDAKRCWWAGEKHFYLRRFEGEVRRDE